MIMSFTKINNTARAIFIYLCFGVSVSTVDRDLNSTWVDLYKVCNRKIQWPTIPVWWQKKGYCSDMSNVVSAIYGTSHEVQIPPNKKTYFQQANYFH
jgi:hypothetical protein